MKIEIVITGDDPQSRRCIDLYADDELAIGFGGQHSYGDVAEVLTSDVADDLQMVSDLCERFIMEPSPRAVLSAVDDTAT